MVTEPSPWKGQVWPPIPSKPWCDAQTSSAANQAESRQTASGLALAQLMSWPLRHIRRNTNELRQNLPMPWMWAVAFSDLACIPTRHTDLRSNRGRSKARKQRLNLLREHFARKPDRLRRCVPFRACLCMPSPRCPMFGTSFRAAGSYAAQARSANQAFRCRFNRTTSTVGAFIRDRFSAASTDMIRLRRFDCGYPNFALGLSTSLLSKTRRKN